MLVTSTLPIRISGQSLLTFQSLVTDPTSAPFVLNALHGIRQDPTRYGRPFLGVSTPGSTRTEVVALHGGQQQLWLFWNTTMNPIEIVMALISPSSLPKPQP
jgi:hypothetical protein